MLFADAEDAAQQAVDAGVSAINISLIRTDGGTQSRQAIYENVVSDYAEKIAEGEEFPPVVVFFDGENYWLADGFHRLGAHKKAEVADVKVDVRNGTRRDAILYSVGANASHGLRRTNEDKRRAVLTLLNDDEWRQWSDREIARRCGVHHQMVSTLRPPTLDESSSDRTYTDRHGNVTTMNTANIGRSAEPPSGPDDVPPRRPIDQVKIDDILWELSEGMITRHESNHRIAKIDPYWHMRGSQVEPSTPLQTRRYDESQEREILQAAREIAQSRPEVVLEILPHHEERKRDTIVSKFTGDQESYTPSKYVEAARLVMGGIDVDPASNPLAQKVVKAAHWYDIETNGLEQRWKGTVFLNPPYSHPEIAHFIDKLCRHVGSGEVTAAVLLTNNNTDTKWWVQAARLASAICLTTGRINFYKADGSETQPTNGQSFFYFGEDAEAFTREFSKFGLIVKMIG